MTEAKEKIYTSFDPGQTTGWSKFDDQGKLIEFGQVGLVDLLMLCRNFVEDYEVIHCIYEDYKIFGHKANSHIGTTPTAVQAIGIIKAVFIGARVPMTKQPASILPIAEQWAQYKIPKKHSISHQVSAYLHGYYWLHNNGVILTELQKKMAQQVQTIPRFPVE